MGQFRRKEQLEALGDAPVQQPALGGAHLRVCGFAEQVVGEVVAVTELVQDPAPPQLVDRPHYDAGVQVAGLSEQIQGEVRPHRGREASHLPGSQGCLRETVVQHRGEISGRSRRAAEIDAAADCLDDVQGKAPRRRLEQARIGRTEGPPGDRLGETCCVGDLERAEGKFG